MAARALLLGIALMTSPGVGCGSSSSTTKSSFAGVYAATWSGTYIITSPPNVPAGSNTATATITITDLPNGEVGASFQLPSNPPSGAITFALTGNSGMALGPATGGMCFVGQVNGNTQTNCCTSCSITFSGNTFEQPNAGTLTGTTPTGTAYAGTYSGTWSATRQ